MPASWVDINVDDGTSLEAYLTQPEGDGSHPAVVVIQEIWGVNSHIQAVTDRLPSQGYVGLAPAMFHRQGRMIAGLHEELQTAVGRMQQCNDAGILADVNAAVNYLKGQSSVNGKIGDRRVLLWRTRVLPGRLQRLGPLCFRGLLWRQHRSRPGQRLYAP